MADGMMMTAPIFGHDTQEEDLRGIEVGTELYLRYAGETIPTGVYFGANRDLHLIDVVFNGISSSVNPLSSTSISELSAFPNTFQNQLDVEIEFTGLRPGEKLYEELLANGEETTKTYHDKIMIAKTLVIDYDKIKEIIQYLFINKEILSNNQIVTKLKEIVPEYISKNSKFEKLDKVS